MSQQKNSIIIQILYTAVDKWCWQTGIAVARHKTFNTILIDSALTDVDAAVAARPKIFRISDSVIPPCIGYIVDLKWSSGAIVLDLIQLR
jgi:hypothetical protein